MDLGGAESGAVLAILHSLFTVDFIILNFYIKYIVNNTSLFYN